MTKHEVQFSEPWDFEHPNGTNKFCVSGLGILSGPDKENWGAEYFLLAVDIPFTMDGQLVSQIICAPRYSGDTLKMAMESTCTVGIARVKPEFKLMPGGKLNTDEVNYCAIGSIKTI
ncbi:hypothetical protein [Porticoccus sp.]